MLKLKFGLIIFLTELLPTHYIVKVLIEVIFRYIFKTFPPDISTIFSMLIGYLVAFLLTTAFINKTDLVNRLPHPIPGINLITYSSLIILIPQLLTILTSTQAGWGNFAIMFIATPVTFVAKLVFYIGIIKLLMAVKPHDSYAYR
ncbi:hypothetical protein [Neptunomonas sp.]|uniref:hypothetical protein n=1 Tax=Neptunomonas sp. TaxID=1971898 RepID=UPI00356132F0